MTPGDSGASADLVERLLAHRALAGVPRAQLEWLAARGSLRRMAEDEVVVRPNEEIPELWIVLSGHLVIRVGQGPDARKRKEWFGGDVAGALPYSRMARSIGLLTAEEPSEAVLVDRRHFPEMIRDCYDVTAVLVHEMVDRARHFTSDDLQTERILSLGRLSARLAHELNNPASAVARGAEELARRLPESLAAFRTLGTARLPADQLATIDEAADVCVTSGGGFVRSPIEQLDREEEIAEWLQAHDVDATAAGALAESTLTLEALDRLAGLLDRTTLDVTLRALAAGCATRKLTSEIERAASRIHHLVAAVKGFTYMDQATVPKPVDLGRGLTDTITVLQAKARAKSARITLDLPPGLPAIQGFGGELNQVWANLIDNALDAVGRDGHVHIAADVEGDSVVVRVTDNGAGIPTEVRTRLFEPFFTTKPVGEGTGLGLDIAKRLVNRHEGRIEFDSRPGHTEFCVVLPLKAPAAGSAHEAPRS